MSAAVSPNLSPSQRPVSFSDFPDATTNRIKQAAGAIFLLSGQYRRGVINRYLFSSQEDPDNSEVSPPPDNIGMLQSTTIRFATELEKIAQSGVCCSTDPNLLEAILYSDDLPDLTTFTLNDLSATAITARLLDSTPLLDACQNELIKRHKSATDDRAITTILLIVFSQDTKIHNLLSPTLKWMPEQELLSLASCLASNEIALIKLTVRETITDQGLQQLLKRFPDIQKLDLSNCVNLTAAAITAIAKDLKALTHLDLSGCQQLTDAAVIAIATNLSTLTDLNLQGCWQLTDAAITAIAANLKALTHLGLSGCRLTNAAVTAIAKDLKALTHLDLSGFQLLRDTTVIAIATNLKALTHLNLSWCWNLTDAAITAIATNLTALRHLDLSNCTRITDAAKQSLRSRGIIVKD